MTGNTILVVDDSPTDLRVVGSALEAHGYKVVTASDGDEAMSKAVSERPRCILLDVVMPRKNGYQVCRQLKATPETKGIPVLLLTSKNQDSDRFWGMKQGADEYLTKPFEPTALLAAVSRYA